MGLKLDIIGAAAMGPCKDKHREHLVRPQAEAEFWDCIQGFSLQVCGGTLHKKSVVQKASDIEYRSLCQVESDCRYTKKCCKSGIFAWTVYCDNDCDH